MSDTVFKNFLLTDYKTLCSSFTQNDGDAIHRLLERYKNKVGDYEKNELSQAIFIRLGWDYRYTDTIFNFYFIYLLALDIISKQDDCDCEYICDFKIEKGKLYYRKKTNSKYESCFYCKKEKIAKKSLDEKMFLFCLRNELKKDSELFSKLERLAHLNDSFVNFMPHPGYPYNQEKGTSNILDSLNLMIDKIQEQSTNLEDDKIKKMNEDWKNWFIKHREDYCLEGFYSINEGGIQGTKFLTNGNDIPTNRDDLIEYISTLISKLEERADLINERLR